MKLRSTHSLKQHPFNAELVTNSDPNILGPLAIKRLDNDTIIALSDVIGVPGAPGSTVKYQLLEVSPEERERLDKEAGLTVAGNLSDYSNWLQNYQKWTREPRS